MSCTDGLIDKAIVSLESEALEDKVKISRGSAEGFAGDFSRRKAGIRIFKLIGVSVRPPVESGGSPSLAARLPAADSMATVSDQVTVFRFLCGWGDPPSA